MSFKPTIGVKKLGQNVIDIILRNIETVVPKLPNNINTDPIMDADYQKIIDLFGDLFYDNSGVKRLISFAQFGNVYIAKVVDGTSTKPYVFLAYNIYDVVYRFNAGANKPVQYIKLYESKYDCDYIVTNDTTTFSFNVIFTKKSDKSVEEDVFGVDGSAEIINFTCTPDQIQVNRFYKKITPVIIDDKNSGMIILDVNGIQFEVPYSIGKDEKINVLDYIYSVPLNKIKYALKVINSTYDFYYKIDHFALYKKTDYDDEEPKFVYLDESKNEEPIYAESGVWVAKAILNKVCDVTVVDSKGNKHTRAVDFNSTTVSLFLEENPDFKEIMNEFLDEDEYIESYEPLKRDKTPIAVDQFITDSVMIVPIIKKKKVDAPTEEVVIPEPEPVVPEPIVEEPTEPETPTTTTEETESTENEENPKEKEPEVKPPTESETSDEEHYEESETPKKDDETIVDGENVDNTEG